MVEGDTPNAAPPAAEELPWERARRERLAQIEAAQTHGERLLARYGRDDHRPRFASVARVSVKRRRR